MSNMPMGPQSCGTVTTLRPGRGSRAVLCLNPKHGPQSHERLVPDVPRKIPFPAPLNKLKDTAVDALKNPRGTSERLIGQAKGAATAGRHLAGGLATQVVDQVNTRTRRRRAADAPRAESKLDTHAAPSPAPRKAHGDPVAPHPAPDAPSAEPVPTTEARVTATKATPADVAKKAAAKKTPGKKTPAKKTPAKKTAAKKAAAKKTAKKAPAEKAAVESGSPTPEAATGAPGDKLPPRTASASAPAPPPTEVEPNPEATPPR